MTGVQTCALPISFTLPITPNQWVSYDIPLTAFSPVNMADVIQFKFAGGTGTQAIFLDNIYFYKPTAVGVNDHGITSGRVQAYPNPALAGEEVHLGTEVDLVEVYDMSGRIMISQRNATLNTQGLNQGMYLLKVQTREGLVETEKLLVK